MKTYIVSHLGQELGPHTEAELQKLWDKKEILPIDYVFDEAKQDWFLLTDVFEWAQQLTSITSIRDLNRMDDEGPPALNKIERTRADIVRKTAAEKSQAKQSETKSSSLQEKAKIKVKVQEDPPPSEVILRRPKNIPYTTQFKAGQAKVDLSDLAKTPGAFTLKELPGSPLKFKEAFNIEVRPATPKKLVVRVPYTIQAGQEINVKLEAVDETFHFCPNLDGYAELSIHTSTHTRVERVAIIKGLGHFAFTHTRAEKLTFEISNLKEINDIETLKIATEPACHLEVLAGPALHMTVIGSSQFIVGQPIELELQAVDQFGNFVKNFSAKVDIEANKSSVTSASNSKGKVS